MVVEGEEMRISALGGTITYRDPRIAAMIGDPDTHWFYETGGDTLGNSVYRNVWHLHRIWVNAPELDLAPGWGGPMEQNSPNLSTLSSSPTSPSSSAIEVIGTAGTKMHLASLPSGLLDQVGAHQRTTIHGNFPNRETKSLTIQRLGAEIWSSGDLNDSGEWTIELDRVRQSADSYQIHVRYFSETTRRFGFQVINVTDRYGPALDLRSTVSNDGDVIVRASLHSLTNR